MPSGSGLHRAMQAKNLTSQEIAELSEKIDRILPIVEALGAILVRRNTVIERTGCNKNTLNSRERFEEVGKRKTYIEIGEVPVVKSRKRNKKRG